MLVRFDKQERLYRVIKLIRPLHLNLQRTMERDLVASGISPTERVIIEFFMDAVMTVQQAAQKLSMKRQFVQRVSAGLLERGLLEKRANPSGERAQLLTASEAAHHIFKSLHDRELRTLHDMLGDINQTEVVAALRVITRLADAFEERASRDIQR